ncbi:MAG: four-carbon acid sugar kinase family protein [Vulcanisaeta sp.]
MLEVYMDLKFIVISDDLTGANGISGFMSRFCNSIVINYDNSFINDVASLPYNCVVVNTKSRMIDGVSAKNRVNYVLGLFNNGRYRFGKRIDSALRGNIEDEILPFIEGGFIIVITDTIPEYGRYTTNGFTVINNSRDSILTRFSRVTPIIINDINKLIDIKNTTGKVFIIDSRSHDDLRKIANFITRNQNIVPVDPLYLIAYTAQQHAALIHQEQSRLIMNKVARRIAFVIGSTQEMTIKQINYAKSHGFYVIRLYDLIKTNYAVDNDWIIIYFDYVRDRGLLTQELVKYLMNFDAIVLSGGETANFIFELSGGLFIESIADIMPLIGVGIIKGGILDGKLIVTKGGFIGKEDTYVIIRDFLLGLSAKNKNR